jgi:hypothetical protein
MSECEKKQANLLAYIEKATTNKPEAEKLRLIRERLKEAFAIGEFPLFGEEEAEVEGSLKPIPSEKDSAAIKRIMEAMGTFMRKSCANR